MLLIKSYTHIAFIMVGMHMNKNNDQKNLNNLRDTTMKTLS